MSIFRRNTDRAGRASDLLAPAPRAVSSARRTFSVTYGDVATVLESTLGGSSQVTRETALAVPAVVTARNLIAGGISQLPLDLFSADRSPAPSDFQRLFTQPESSHVRTVSVARLVEDLLFFSVAYWEVKEFGWHGYPVRVKRICPEHVSVPDTSVNRILVSEPNKPARYVSTDNLIVFQSPNPALLISGSSAIRALKLLDAAALNAASGVPPVDYLTPTDGYDPDEAEVQTMLDGWATARQARRTAFLPSGYSYESAEVDAEKIQLSAARDYGVLEIARLTGVSPEELGVAVTSRTYSNIESDRRFFVTNVLNPYLVAIEQRLSLNDVCPRGYFARFSLSEYQRADDASRMQVAAAGIASGVFTPEQARAYFDPDSPVNTAPALPAPESAPQ